MLSVLLALMPVLVVLAVVGATEAFLCARSSLAHDKKTLLSLARGFLRSPGHFLYRRIEEHDFEIYSLSALLLVLPLQVLVVHILTSYIVGEPETLLRIVVSTLAAAAGITYIYWRITKVMSEREAYREGLEFERATAQELNQLMLQGCRVFHDVPVGMFNIDHVIVGPAGVFAVETKARRQSLNSEDDESAKVVYDGECLHFPDWEEKKPIKQARWQAVWLARWLSESLERQIDVCPVIALPGWHVENGLQDNEVKVINPQKAALFYSLNGESALSDEQIEKIATEIDARCRDV